MSDEKKTKNNNAVVEGTICHIGEEQSVGAKGAPKRLVVVKTGGEYPQTVPVEFFGKNFDKAQPLAVGDEVLIAVNLRGREAKGNWYGSLDAWNVKVTKAADAVPPPVHDNSDPLPF